MTKLSSAKNLLIIRLSSLGDILLTTPLVRSLKSQYLDLNIDFLIRDKFSDVMIHNPHINNLLTLNNNYEEMALKIKKAKYDLIIDLQNNHRSHKLTRKSWSKKLRFNKHDIKKFLLVNFKINGLKELPPIPARYAKTIKNFNLDEKGLEIFLSPNVKSELKDNGNYIALAPGSQHFTKMWPKYYYIYITKMLLVNNFQVVLLGGKSDKEVCDEIAELLPKTINLCSNDDILQTAAHMKKCRAVICNDSGMMHTACAVGVPVLAFFGSTVKEFGFTPYKNNNLILENDSLSCRPCSHIGRSECPKKHFQCMLDMTPQFAFRKLNTLLNPHEEFLDDLL